MLDKIVNQQPKQSPSNPSEENDHSEREKDKHKRSIPVAKIPLSVDVKFIFNFISIMSVIFVVGVLSYTVVNTQILLLEELKSERSHRVKQDERHSRLVENIMKQSADASNTTFEAIAKANQALLDTTKEQLTNLEKLNSKIQELETSVSTVSNNLINSNSKNNNQMTNVNTKSNNNGLSSSNNNLSNSNGNLGNNNNINSSGRYNNIKKQQQEQQ